MAAPVERRQDGNLVAKAEPPRGQAENTGARLSTQQQRAESPRSQAGNRAWGGVQFDKPRPLPRLSLSLPPHCTDLDTFTQSPEVLETDASGKRKQQLICCRVAAAAVLRIKPLRETQPDVAS